MRLKKDVILMGFECIARGFGCFTRCLFLYWMLFHVMSFVYRMFYIDRNMSR